MTGSLLQFYAEHHAKTQYGTGGFKKIAALLQALEGGRVKSLLDWGAGSQTLGRTIKQQRPEWEVVSYDPAVPGIDVLPDRQFDAVVSTDVLEHIPYEEIDEAIEQILGLTKNVGYHYIASGPASLLLPDGRNAHLIQENSKWWAEKFRSHGASIAEASDVESRAGDVVVYRAAKIKLRKDRT